MGFMKTRSAKNKGMRLQKLVGQMIADAIGEKFGYGETVRSAFASEVGRDIVLTGSALEKYPFSVECKNQEKWNIGAYIAQAAKNRQMGTEYQVIISKNNFDPHVIMRLDAFLEFWKAYNLFVKL